MKKIVLVLALVLSLVLCAFAFASCGKDKAKSTTAATTVGNAECAHEWNTEYTIDTPATCARVGSKSIHCVKCGAQKPGSVEEVEKLAHTESADYIVDLEPNCSENGYKSKHCTVCGAIIDSTIEPLDADESRHNVENWTVTTPATMFNQTGARTGECTICHNPVNEVLTYEPTVLVCDGTSTGRYEYEQMSLADIRGDKHFYPTTEDPEGNDLYVEYSVLWNPSMLNLDGANNTKNPYIVVRFQDNDPILYWSPTTKIKTSDAKDFPGAFEWMGHYSVPVSDAEVTTPPEMCGPNGTYAQYPNIGGTAFEPDVDNLDNGHEWGWHRVAIRYHLELADEAAVKVGAAGDDKADYVGTVTCYIDGVAVFKLKTASTGNDAGIRTLTGSLFTAETDGEGGIKYTDMDDNWVNPFELQQRSVKTDTTAYVVIADVMVTCGKDFAMKVEKVATPTANTFTVEEEGAEPVEINAPIYFKLAD